MAKKEIINVRADDDLEKIEEEIITAAEKAGKKNVIVNIFSYPHERLKRRWHIRYKFNKKHLIMDLAIVAAVFALIGLNIFWLYGGFHYFANQLKLSVSADDNYVSGQKAVFAINYANENKFKLEDAVLSVKLPNNFILESVSRPDFDAEHNVLALGDLASGANGKLEIAGQVIGEIYKTQRMAVNLAYYKTDKKGERLWGQFNQNAYREYEISGGYIGVESILPDKMVADSIVDWPFTIKNMSPDITYEKIIIQTQNNKTKFNNIVIKKFKPGEMRNFGVSGEAGGAEHEQFVLRAVWEDSGFVLTQAEWIKNVQTVQPNFSVEQSVGATAITPGEAVAYEIKYKNDGAYSIESAAMEVNFAGNFWDLANSDFGAGQKQAESVVWTFKKEPKLALIQPGETGLINFIVKTKEFVPAAADIKLESVLFLSFKVEGLEAKMPAEKIEIPLNTNLSMKVYPMYYAATGDQLGRGPLPPKVGAETKYWVFAQMVNDINPVDNVKVSVTLPLNVVWTGKASVPVGDPIKYNDADRSLSWQISQVPVRPESIGFALELAIIPTVGQKGTYPALLTDLVVEGTDKITGQVIKKNIGAVNTALNFDIKGKKKDGAVK